MYRLPRGLARYRCPLAKGVTGDPSGRSAQFGECSTVPIFRPSAHAPTKPHGIIYCRRNATAAICLGAHCLAPVGLSDLSPCPLYASGGKPYGFYLAVLAAQPGGFPCVPAPWQQKKPLSAAPDNDFYSKSPCGDSCPMFAVVCSLRRQYNTQLFSLSSPLINNLPPFARGARAAVPHVGSRVTTTPAAEARGGTGGAGASA